MGKILYPFLIFPHIKSSNATYNGVTTYNDLHIETQYDFKISHKNYSLLSFPSHHFSISDDEKRGDYWLDLEGKSQYKKIVKMYNLKKNLD